MAEQRGKAASPLLRPMRRGPLFWTFAALHGLMLLWWPLSVLGAVFSLGAVSAAATSYLLVTSAAYPLVVAGAFGLGERLAKSGAATGWRIAAYALPFLTGTYIEFPILFPPLAIGFLTDQGLWPADG